MFENITKKCHILLFEGNMFCPNCGEDCGDVAKFCQSCGNKLNREQKAKMDNGALHHGSKTMDTMINEKSRQTSPVKPMPFEGNGWFCDNCTFFNTDLTTNICEMCHRTSDRKIAKKQVINV